MKVLRGTKVRNISECARKSVHILCAHQYTPLFPDITAYWSRHTWATIAASLDIPIETISAALGHSYGSPTTAIYIAFDQRKVDDANRRVIDYVNGRSV